MKMKPVRLRLQLRGRFGGIQILSRLEVERVRRIREIHDSFTGDRPAREEKRRSETDSVIPLHFVMLAPFSQ